MKKLIDISTIIVGTILILIAILSFILLVPKKKTANIIIIAGQSNAEGVSEYADLNGVLSEEKYNKYSNGTSRVKFIARYSLDNFVNFKVGLNEYKNTFGIELGVIDYFLDTNKKDNLFVVKCAVGGTGLSYWQKGEEGYNRLSTTVNRAIELIKKDYSKINIQAMCWMQGESDRKDLDSEKYFNRLNTFVSTLREDYKTYGNFRFVDAAILKSEYSDKINKSKSEFANLSDNNYYFEVAEFNFSLIDDVHYNAASEYKLGYEFGKYCF